MLLAGGCRQLDTQSPGAAAMSVARPIDPPVASAPSPFLAANGDYRVAADGNRENLPVTGDQTSPSACLILPQDDLDQFLDAARAGAVPLFDDAGSFFPELSNEPAQAIPGQTVADEPSKISETDNGGPAGRIGRILVSTWDDALQDYGNYYSRRTALEFAAILAPAAVFANSDLDYRFGNWYQANVRSAETNRVAAFVMPLGNGYYTIPVYVSAKFIGEYFDDLPGMSLLGEWGDRTTRALLVGALLLLAAQYVLGAGRPEAIDDSYWKPFRSSHGASGHAFMGAVPFITLADMTDDPLAKCFFFACSPWTGMARINDNLHYLSQVWLGWWLAYLACDNVNRTDKQKGAIMLSPIVSPEMSGVGVVYAH